MDDVLLEIENLSVYFPGRAGKKYYAVRELDLTLQENKTLAIVGESGSGKSMTALAVMGMLPAYAKQEGAVRFGVQDLSILSQKKRRKYYGNEIAMIYEQPMSCLNPTMTVGRQIAEAYRNHFSCGHTRAKLEALSLMEEVGLAESKYKKYPHELSGGMQQRVMIAIAISGRPRLLIADEPTTSLDVTIQMQIIQLLKGLIDRYNMAMLLITHDMGLVAELADDVLVLYGGRVMEQAEVFSFFDAPSHPYAQALVDVIRSDAIEAIEGSAPNLFEPVAGCPFSPRCAKAIDVCNEQCPPLARESGRVRRCHIHA